MTKVRLVAASLFAWAPAAAGVVEIPAASGRAPLSPSVAVGAAGGVSGVVTTQSRSPSPSLPPSVLAPPLSAFVSAPRPEIRGAAQSAAPSDPAFAAQAADARPQVPSAAAAEGVAPPVQSAPFAPAASPAVSGLVVPGSPAPLAPADFDALFDGRGPNSAAAAEPSRPGEASAAPARGPSRRGFLRRRAFSASVPLAAAAAAFAAPHAALLAAHSVGQAAYWLANPLAFLFTLPQIHRMISRRSAEIAPSMTIVGLLAAAVTALCFAYDGKDLMMYRNLAQTAGFAAMFGLQARFSRTHLASPSRARALIETAAVVLVTGAVMLAGGPALLAVAPSLHWIGSFLGTLQVFAGFGFTYMMYAQLKKMRAERSSGDASSGMMWAFLGTKTIWVWSFTTMLALAAAPAWSTLAVGAAFAALSWFASKAALSRLLRAAWNFFPARVSLGRWSVPRAALGDGAAFVGLSALILALSLAGWAAFTFLLDVRAASSSTLAMYAIYTVQNLVSCVATLETLRQQKRFDLAARDDARP